MQIKIIIMKWENEKRKSYKSYNIRYYYSLLLFIYPLFIRTYRYF